MLYDRPYMRQGSGFRRDLPVYGWILIILIAIFLLQNLLEVFFRMDGLVEGEGGRRGGFLPNWLALTEANLSQFKIWTLFTYSLFHGSPFHLLGNGIVIFFIGRILEARMGGESLLKLYIFSVILGGIFWAAVNWWGPGGLVIGASAGALGLLIYFCLKSPNEPMTLLLFFVVPVTVLPKWIGWGIFGIEVFGLVFSEIGSRQEVFGGGDNLKIAHSAHLGGMAAAYLFYRYEAWFRKLSFPRIRFGDSGGEKNIRPRYRVNMSGSPAKKAGGKSSRKSSDLREEVDRILDKINSSGFGSLTDEEKETLNRAKELLRK